MVPKLCAVSALNLSDPCVRATWGTLVPAAFVVLFLVASIPVPRAVRDALNPIIKPFRTFVTLPEAEAIQAQVNGDKNTTAAESAASPARPASSLWRTFVLAAITVSEVLAWTIVGSYALVVDARRDVWATAVPFVVASTWGYAAVRAIFFARPTPHYDLFVLFLAKLASSLLSFGGVIFDAQVEGIKPSTGVIVAHSFNLAAVLALLVVMLSTPIAVPSTRVKREELGRTLTPEDYTTLWGWLSFGWVTPTVGKGTKATLKEDDVWTLSPTIQSRVVFARFTEEKRATLLRWIVFTNLFDLFWDFILTIVSSGLHYTSPFFLNLILTSIGPGATPESRSKAYVYAALAFVAIILRSESDLQHLWFGRRAAVRVRSELMAAIYDKALKRKDFSGIVEKKKDKKKDGDGKEDDEEKSSADVGKIVNLMSNDANRISNMLSIMTILYSAPVEIVIASIYLYRLLGWSAFAGFITLIPSWPINSYLMKRAFSIQKDLSTARDKRMGVLNELITAIKFIKFFAWEDRWIERALAARETEMKWMIKSRTNLISLRFVFVLSPMLVSFGSFFTYVYLGNKLDVATAFTALTLFNMIRRPLGMIPMFAVQLLQTGVAINRIAAYLDEDEVSGQVSSLKRDATASRVAEDEQGDLGFENASFKWNEIEKKDEDKKKKKEAKRPIWRRLPRFRRSRSSSPSGASETTAAVEAPEQPEHRFELRDLNVKFPQGVLTVVTGPTASGKTALLMALLGEMTQTDGRLIMAKDASRVDKHGFAHVISYAAQSPWLRHQSIKDNILFGYPYDEERYNEVIECCALKTDLEIFEDGDQTEIGARGVSLSGGQKARVALARAVYARTKYVLLDDPLSAVDSHTARFLFDRLLRGPLLANRTVILVTHHVELVLPAAKYIVRMLDGRVDTHGTPASLRSRGVLAEITASESVEEDREQIPAEAAAGGGKAGVAVTEAEEVAKLADPAKKPRKLVDDEHREQGAVKWSIYNTYLKASSYWTWAFVLFFIIVGELLGVGEKLWIRVWGNAYAAGSLPSFHSFHTQGLQDDTLMAETGVYGRFATSSVHMQTAATSWLGFDLPDANERPLFYVGIYGLIGLAFAMGNLFSTIVQVVGTLRASRLLFKKLLNTVVHATMRWHDTTPQGRMLNRFSKDIETIDGSLAGSIEAVNSSLASFFASIITIGVILPGFLVPAAILAAIYYKLAIGYLNTGRDLRRMESNTRSPIFSSFSELLEGIVTVRAFSAENRFLDFQHEKVDLTTKMHYAFWMTNRWLLVRFDVLGGFGVFLTTIFVLSGVVDSGLAGVCITSAMAFTTGVYWACRFWTALELDLNSVERVVEYLDLPQEPPAIVENSRPPAYWPSSSNKDSLISVQNLTVKYAPDLPAVLHDISFSLGGRERVGLLGRTGSGKSTLAMSVLRFVDPAGGRITIDGIDISKIGVHDLRSRLTFIPQDATLFSGTLRENLDPFNDYTDDECLDVLHRVHMITDSAYQSQRTSRQPSRAPSVHGTSLGAEPSSPTSASAAASTIGDNDQKTTVSLTTQVSAGGTNFSQGQRQLIAMARALLRRSSIIILDEATSSIDFETDTKIQKTIREEFGDSLLLTVAHRLKTVIDYDRLIVLDKGTIAEFDTPYNLIKKQDGIFRNMCLKSGVFSELETAAKDKASGL